MLMINPEFTTSNISPLPTISDIALLIDFATFIAVVPTLTIILYKATKKSSIPPFLISNALETLLPNSFILFMTKEISSTALSIVLLKISELVILLPNSFILFITKEITSTIFPIDLLKISVLVIVSLRFTRKSPNDAAFSKIVPPKPEKFLIRSIMPFPIALNNLTPISNTANTPLKVRLISLAVLSLNLNFSVRSLILTVNS